VDGARSAGGQAQHQKNNLQLAQASELSAQLQAMVKAALHRNALFFSAALPRRIFNPLFNNYGDGANYYGNHVDSAVMHSKADNCWVRSDLSCTLFLTAARRLRRRRAGDRRGRWAKSASSCLRAT
jgi:PKHD-type hydroxylase